jgi:hypothetical protein
MKKFTRTGNPELETNGIKEIVWNGKYVDTDRHIVRGAVGQTSTGGYKSAEVHVSLELDNGRVSGSRESWKWNGEVHPEKDQAILASCEAVEHIVEKDRQAAKTVETRSGPSANVAHKYGSTEPPERELPPPSRSR